MMLVASFRSGFGKILVANALVTLGFANAAYSPANAQTLSTLGGNRDLATAISQHIDQKLNKSTRFGPVAIISLSAAGARSLIARGLARDFDGVSSPTPEGENLILSTEGPSDDCSPSVEAGDKLYNCVYARNERASFRVSLIDRVSRCRASGTIRFDVIYSGFRNRIWANLVSNSGNGQATYSCDASGMFRVERITYFRWVQKV